MLGFVIWVLCGIAFIGIGIFVWNTKRDKAIGFWANAKPFPVKNVKEYHRALGKLWCVYGAVFIFLGFPLLAGQNSPYALISIIGVLWETIIVMILYVTKIETKYKKNSKRFHV